MADEPTLLGAPPAGAPGAAEGADKGGTPTAEPKGGAADPAKDKPADPTGSGQDPAKGGSGAADPNDPNKGAPEKGYADFTLPDGFKLVPEVAEEFKAIAKGMNLTQEAAQKIVDLQVKAVSHASNAAQAEFKAVTEGWKKETIQALGANHEEQLGIAAKAIDKFGSPTLRKFLDDTGFGNHKDLVTFFINVGKAIREDTLPGGKPTGDASKSLAERIYPPAKK